MGASGEYEEGELTGRILGAAIGVHTELGPGLLESIYVECLCFELRRRGIAIERQVPVRLRYCGVELEKRLVVDLVVEERVLVEVKAVAELTALHAAQLRSYLRLGGYEVGLLLNFNAVVMREGIQRVRLGRWGG